MAGTSPAMTKNDSFSAVPRRRRNCADPLRGIPGGGRPRRSPHGNHASPAVLRDCHGLPHPVVWGQSPHDNTQRTRNSGENPMARLKFGAFLAPHHPIGEHPMLQFRRDLDFVEQLDALGYDEFWCGEHHSSGWEMIASPEMFLAAAGERTKRIKLGTGVISLPYHHPFNVAQRMVQLDHMTGGRAIFGSGPGALASDAHTLGIDPMTQRDRQDEAIAIIRRLFRGERVTAKSDWFTMNDAALQILPLQEDMPFVVASQISPSGMTLAGKYGIGIISLGSMSTQGLMALPTQWGFAEFFFKEPGTTVSRANWRVLLSWHIAETREQARREAGAGLMRWHNEYNVGTLQRPG